MHFVLDDNNNKVEAYDKEEVLALLNQAIKDGSLANLVADAAFISKLKCCVGGSTHKIAFVTQAEYNRLYANGQILANCLYLIKDDTTADDINKHIERINALIDGDKGVPKAEYANNYTRVHSVYLAFANANNESGDIMFNWYTNTDKTFTLETLIDDIVEQMGKETGTNQKEAWLPCYGRLVEVGNSVEPIMGIVLKTVKWSASTTFRYASIKFMNSAAGAQNIDISNITATITKLN